MANVNTKASVNTSINDIAIVGMSCRFPGETNSPKEFFEFIMASGDGIVEVPSDRWNVIAYYDQNKEKPNKMYVNQGGFIKGIDQFDPQFFGISPKEAPYIDPQQRWLLELTYEAFENAGILPSELKGSDTAVYIGQFMHDFEQVQLDPASQKLMSSHTATGSSMTLSANRISYSFDFTGPSIALDTACSSSLVALDMACNAILNGDTHLALAGGVNILLRPQPTMSICNASMLSPDCRCKPFDVSANGYVRSEGAGLVLLKSYADAVRDGNNVVAIIKATSVNQDGKTEGITVPSGESQKKLLKRSLQRANITGSDIQYVEAHGTGTAVGDPIEVNALGSVLGQRPKHVQRCVIGSVKSNIGHCEAAAGIAGLIKTVMAMNEGVIPPNIHYHSTNPAIDLEQLNFRIADKALEWPDADGQPRRAMVNSFGFGGTNANVILQGSQVVKTLEIDHASQTPIINGEIKLLPISSKTKQGLKDQARKYLEYLQQIEFDNENQSALLHNICYTASNRREHFKYRLVILGENIQAIIDGLEDFISDIVSSTAYIQGVAGEKPAKLPCFVFAGMGPQWAGMGRELYKTEPVYKDALDKCSEALEQYTGWSLVEAILQQEDPEAIHATYIAQPAIFATQMALVELLKSWGVEPGCIVGHSAGEVAAAYAAGAYDFNDAIKVIYHRSRLQHTTEGTGKMLAVGLTEAALQPYLVGLEDKISIAAINSEEAISIAGDEESLISIADKLDDQGIFARFLNVSVPYHSPIMDQIKVPLHDALSDIVVDQPITPLYSTVTSELTQINDWGPDYWPRNVRESVKFQATIKQIAKDGFDTFIEISPHIVLESSIQKNLSECRTVTTLKRNHADDLMLQHTLAYLHVTGIGVDWSNLYPNGGQLIQLPNYAWQHGSFWNESENAQQTRLRNVQLGNGFLEPVHPLLGSPINSSAAIWQKTIDLQDLSYLEKHKVGDDIVYPGAAYVEGALAIARYFYNEDKVTLENVEFMRAFFLDQEAPVQIETRLFENDRYFEISAFDLHTSRWECFCRGMLSDIAKKVPARKIDLAEVTKHLTKSMDKKMFYQHCHALGLSYEGAFQLVEQSWAAADECVVEVHFPTEIIDTYSNYQLHPVLLDGAFQAFFPTVQHGYLPVKIAEFNFYKTPNEKFYCHLLTDYKDDNNIIGHLTLFDDEGDVLVEIMGVELKSWKTLSSLDSDNVTIQYDYEWQKLELVEEEGITRSKGKWLIFPDRQGIGTELAIEMERRGQSVKLIEADRQDASVESLLSILDEASSHCAGIIYLWALDTAPSEHLSSQEILESCQQSCVIPTRIAQAINQIDWHNALKFFLVSQCVYQLEGDTSLPQPAQGVLWGFGRVLASEHAEHHMTMVDLPAHTNSDLIHQLVDNLLSHDYEQEIALRSSGRFVHRLRPLTKVELNQYVDETDFASGDSPFRLVKDSKPAQEAKLRYQSVDLPELGAGQLSVRVVSSSVGSDPSIEQNEPCSYACAGIVESVGCDIDDWKTGDQVIVFGHREISSWLHAHPSQVVAKPETMSAADAATTAAYFTVPHYCLNRLANLQEEETVFIHDAANGYGLAAIQLAQLKNAIVYATADSPEKRYALEQLGVAKVFDSTCFEFIGELSKELDVNHHNKTIDLFLNTQGHHNSIRILNLMSDFGRFIELRPPEKQNHQALNEILFKKNICHYCISPEMMADKRSDLYRELLGEVMTMLSNNMIKLLDVKTFSANELYQLISSLQNNGNIEQHIINLDVDNIAVVRCVTTQLVNADSTYLVTGGLGGLGLVVFDWLVDSGASSIVLTGRSEPKEEAVQKINAAKDKGVHVKVMRADVSDARAMEKVFEDIKDTMKPLAGIVHSAGVLSDGVIAKMTEEQIIQVLTPKVKGAWNLHQLTLDIDLDFFVCFSSISSIIGWAGQSNYASANAFMDTLAHHRRAQGKAALSVNWGPWAEVGMAANLDVRDIQRMKDAGMTPLEPDHGVAAMTDLMAHGVTQAGVFELDWPLIFRQYSDPSKKTVLARFLDDSSASDSADFMKGLLSASQDVRETMLIEKVSQILADILGVDSAENIDKDQSIFEYGMNSLMALEFASHIQGALKYKVSSAMVMKNPTVNALVKNGLNTILANGNGTVTLENLSRVEQLAIDENHLIDINDEDTVEVEW